MLSGSFRTAYNAGMEGTETRAPAPCMPKLPEADAPPAETARPEPELTGGAALPMSNEGFRRFEGRLEVRDADAGTARMVHAAPTRLAHENPSHGRAVRVERIARSHER